MKKLFLAAALIGGMSLFAQELPMNILGLGGSFHGLWEKSSMGDANFQGAGITINSTHIGDSGWGFTVIDEFAFPLRYNGVVDGEKVTLSRKDLQSFVVKIAMGPSYFFSISEHFLLGVNIFSSIEMMTASTENYSQIMGIIGSGVNICGLFPINYVFGLSVGITGQTNFLSFGLVNTAGTSVFTSGALFQFELMPYIMLQFIIPPRRW